jgi:hypothetical protein
MKSQIAFCSACDRDVRIVITQQPSQDGHANLHDSEAVCLEIGETCTGALCPVGAAPPSVMQPVVDAECRICEMVTPHLLVGPTQATCATCGVTSERSPLGSTP